MVDQEQGKLSASHPVVDNAKIDFTKSANLN